tara:strand:+ start:142 stop:510 length:369 start_codon:yes stop_codon:yes gene_type:complete
MEWFQGKAAQLVAFVSIVGTLAGFGYTGATYVNRIENLEKKISMLGATEDAQNEIEERFSAIETSVEYINKTIDDSILITIKQQGEITKVLEIDVSTMDTRVENLEDRMDRAEDSSDNPLAR